MSIFRTTLPSDRRYGIAIFLGIISGILSAMVKSGCEGILPARLPTAMPPPVALLKLFGIDVSQMNYVFNGVTVNWGGNGVHYLFSIVIAIIYCVLAEIFPSVRKYFGLAFGIIVAIVGFHATILPIMGLAEPIWDWTPDALISECIGTPIWIITIEIIRRDLRNRITGLPDPKATRYQ